MSCKSKFSFNTIANVISIASGVTLAGIIGVGSYVYINKDAIIENIKKEAIESVMGNIGGGAIGGALTGDVGIPVPDTGSSLGLPVPGKPF